jgi:RNA polymerase sigma-70 factor (ECF subfamily)
MTEPDHSADALVEQLLRGDPQALAALFARHRDRLGRMVQFRLDARLRGRISTSDVLQDAYLDALQRLPHYQASPDVPFFIWARAVTLQRVVDVHRRHLLAQARAASREVPMAGPGAEASSERMAALMGDATSPSIAAQRGELVARVREALDLLEPLDREVLALRHFEELSNVEAAAALGIRPAAASKRYVRALDRLRAVLEALTGFEGGRP